MKKWITAYIFYLLLYHGGFYAWILLNHNKVPHYWLYFITFPVMHIIVSVTPLLATLTRVSNYDITVRSNWAAFIGVVVALGWIWLFNKYGLVYPPYYHQPKPMPGIFSNHKEAWLLGWVVIPVVASRVLRWFLEILFNTSLVFRITRTRFEPIPASNKQ